MKLYYDSEEEFLNDAKEEESFFQPTEYSAIEQKKRHSIIMNNAMKAKWDKCMLRECPAPGVKDKYGTNSVSVWICFSCSYVKRMPMCGAVGCGYNNG